MTAPLDLGLEETVIVSAPPVDDQAQDTSDMRWLLFAALGAAAGAALLAKHRIAGAAAGALLGALVGRQLRSSG